jgi:hypothetical protein
MKKKIEYSSLTEDQKDLAVQIRDQYLKMFFDSMKEGCGIDKSAFEEGIEWLYKDVFFQENIPEIIYCDSFVDCTKIVNILIEERKFQTGRPDVSPTCNLCNLFFQNNLWMPVQYSFDLSTVELLTDSIVNFISNIITERIKKPVWDTEPKYFTNSYRISIHSWFYNLSKWEFVALYDFASKIAGFESGEFEKYKNIVKSGVFSCYPYNNCLFVIQPPVSVLLNTQGRLHSTEGPAVKFRDGASSYFINGRSVPAWIFEKKERITKNMFLNEENTETKAAIYEVLGQKRMMEMLGAQRVHTSEIQHANGETETVELLKTRDKFPETGDEPFAWVKVTCPSTGTNYLLGVESKYENAAEALASLSMFNNSEYSFNFRT